MYTKGPWFASGNGIHTETGSCVAITHQEPRPQRQEDACLISAAPELYEALKDLVKCNQEWNQAVIKIIGKPELWNESYLDKAIAALSKATTK